MFLICGTLIYSEKPEEKNKIKEIFWGKFRETILIKLN